MFRAVIAVFLSFAVIACSDDPPDPPDGGTGLDALRVDTPINTDTGVGQDAAEPMDAPGMDVDPPPEMSFFITSTGNGAEAGNLGGLTGADAKCQRLATAVGAGGKTWRAYLSTTAMGGDPAVNARDRIGMGPWFNRAGTRIASDVASLHATPPPYTDTTDENGNLVPLMEHDILTGSDTQGMSTAMTCNNWTDSTGNSEVWVGHSNWNDPIGAVTSWNSSHTASCIELDFTNKFGSGRIYCFAL